jgi:hypothetical protein
LISRQASSPTVPATSIFNRTSGINSINPGNKRHSSDKTFHHETQTQTTGPQGLKSTSLKILAARLKPSPSQNSLEGKPLLNDQAAAVVLRRLAIRNAKPNITSENKSKVAIAEESGNVAVIPG